MEKMDRGGAGEQTETKPAVRGSDSGDGWRTSKLHCVGSGNCGSVGRCS